MVPTSSSLAAPAVVLTTTPGATSDDKVGIMTTLGFQWFLQTSILMCVIMTSLTLVQIYVKATTRFFHLVKNKANLYYFKLCVAFRSHWWIQTGVTVRKCLNWVKIDYFLSRVTLKSDGWPSKTIGHLFYAISSFVYQFVAIGEFKLELQSGNAQSGSNSTIFRAVWPWNLTDDLQKQ